MVNGKNHVTSGNDDDEVSLFLRFLCVYLTFACEEVSLQSTHHTKKRVRAISYLCRNMAIGVSTMYIVMDYSYDGYIALHLCGLLPLDVRNRCSYFVGEKPFFSGPVLY